MRKKMIPLLSCFFSFLCLLTAQAADLKTFKDVYEKESKEILQTFQPKFDGLQQQYQKSLEALKAGAQSRGDFTKTSAASDEIERFQKTKSLPATLDERAIQEIKAFQSAYVKQYNRLETDMTAKLGALTVNYGQALDRLLKDQTRAGKLDEAAAVNQELERAQASIKGYAETLAALKGPTATNETPVAASPKPAIAAGRPAGKQDLYMVIDLSGGKDAEKYPVTYLADVPKGGWTDEYKTEKMVLRRIKPGTLKMGHEEPQKARLTRPFYIGVFEVTQRQWELVEGSKPGKFNNPEDCASRPVETVAYSHIRGPSAGANWPATNSVDAVSFVGIIRAKTGLDSFDLPTKTQWDYAARAGSDKPFEGDFDAIAWYKGNSGTHPVGQKRPNAWGLYDMYGNVWEWCLDWSGVSLGEERDPKGAVSGSERVLRGGAWQEGAQWFRSSNPLSRSPTFTSNSGDVGFRAAITLP